MIYDRSNSDNPYLQNLNQRLYPPAPTGPTRVENGPRFDPGMSVAAPFMPEQAPPMLPMQGSTQMPATKGSGQGPMSMQQPMQAPMQGQQPMGQVKPMDLQALIQSLMASGLLGGL